MRLLLPLVLLLSSVLAAEDVRSSVLKAVAFRTETAIGQLTSEDEKLTKLAGHRCHRDGAAEAMKWNHVVPNCAVPIAHEIRAWRLEPIGYKVGAHHPPSLVT
jgi:hypothetical protein